MAMDETNENRIQTVVKSHSHQTSRQESKIVERLAKSLYYGRMKRNQVMDGPSMPLTEVTVDIFEKTVQSCSNGLQVFDMYYASQLTDKACISPCSMMLAIIYIDRLKNTNPDYLRTVSPCDLFIVSMMVASKYLFDDGEEDEVYNHDWADSGDVELKQLNKLEREFLAAINWNIHVDPNSFMLQLAKVESLAAFNECKKRKWSSLTYSDVISLMDSPYIKKYREIWLQLTNHLAKIVILSTVGYSVFVIALFGVATFTPIVVHHSSANKLIVPPLMEQERNNSMAINLLNPNDEPILKYSPYADKPSTQLVALLSSDFKSEFLSSNLFAKSSIDIKSKALCDLKRKCLLRR